MTKPFAAVAGTVFLLAGACSTPKEEVPSLTPQAAATLLQLYPKSKNWLERVRRDNPVCEYRIELPDQSSHPTVIDIPGAIMCGSQPAPRALNATVTYAWKKDVGHWVISRFSS